MSVRVVLTAAVLLYVATVGIAQRRDVFVASRDHAAIAYSTTPGADPVARLSRRLQEGAATLSFDPAIGYLRSLLAALQIPAESQSLVFSPTSFQAPLIDMRNPRALFFNDAVAVAWVRGGAVLEIASLDPRQGVLFYTLDQKPAATPQFTRNDQCLACHLSWETLGVPGLVMMSTLPRPDENAYASGFFTTHGSPFDQRWSGWYVTGNPGAPHLGNRPVTPAELHRSTIAAPARPVTSLDGAFDLEGYPSPHSDVVALMVLGHQVTMTNHLIRIGWEARLAATEGEDAAARVREAAVDVVDYMLFVDEPPLTGRVQGSSTFAETFASTGPVDDRGRSLRQFDLTRRMMRYPCSYMIYSDAFDALPPAARDAIYARLWRVLAGEERGPRYARLTAADRHAIIEILGATKKDLPDYFRTSNTITVAK
jgi:hypothetical protein